MKKGKVEVGDDDYTMPCRACGQLVESYFRISGKLEEHWIRCQYCGFEEPYNIQPAGWGDSSSTAFGKATPASPGSNPKKEGEK
jgi:DNA-directed RNA polymerase subunit RPC12/RpoP